MKIFKSMRKEHKRVYPNFPDWPPGASTANGTTLCHYMQLYRYFVSQSSEFCHHNLLCCFSTSRSPETLDTPSYNQKLNCFFVVIFLGIFTHTYTHTHTHTHTHIYIYIYIYKHWDSNLANTNTFPSIVPQFPDVLK
jgi:hypothetical protein